MNDGRFDGEILDAGRLDRAATERAAEYAVAEPFRHAVFTDLVDPAALAAVAAEIEGRIDEGEATIAEHAHATKGFVGHNRTWTGVTRRLFLELNSATFVRFLEGLTGINGLIPDPHYRGGGIHVIPNGGHLDIHADFSRHDTLDIDRRLNVIVYLNEDWDPDWGGELELWDSNMTRCVESVVPELGTVVVFDTVSDGFHGHPSPLSCPEDRRRLSAATYYYTADGAAGRVDHPTRWRSTSGRGRSLRDWVPPVLFEGVQRLRAGRGGG